ncbi:Dfp1/Him1, central region-domain-containing protein [Collybia nuda]|uniref:Dfp1/Him1, central region-domain-containing protein n=1 Tax=Collybia nuda TaxID=64659 RepID=A0A9P5XWP7_9AGAR|nr:Dfp1/Him1, central region-domain-containing protein [Collybia nuda]
MATLNRRPFSNRPTQTCSPLKPTRTVPGSKRAHSPDPFDINANSASTKRLKSIAPALSVGNRDSTRERKHLEREQQKAEFREKYTRAFPGFIFCFDEQSLGAGASEGYRGKIEHLGAAIDDFFSNTITHFIANRPLPKVDILSDKENNPKAIGEGLLKSPIKLKGRFAEDTPTFDVLAEAIRQDKKIWNTAKLDSVLARLLDDPPVGSGSVVHKSISTSRPPATINSRRSLTHLLQSERVYGTLERDPTQKRHDFRYFARGSKFVLVEDMRQQLATIAVHEYHIPPKGVSKVPWPVLHCHPRARGPFIAYDEREKKRWEKLQRNEADSKEECTKYNNKLRQVEVMKRRAEANLYASRTGDLRRSVSMNNLRRGAALPSGGLLDENPFDFDAEGDNPESVNASGYLLSGTGLGYTAASGNSVGITSTGGTTSTTGRALRNVQLPSALSGRMKQQIVTSRKFPSTVDKLQDDKELMGPPAIPEKQSALRKSRSTNTLKLPKREEGSKPGYCESCRVKFEDFKNHISGRKHKKFAVDDANFFQLDCILARVQRRTREEIQQEARKRAYERQYYCRRVNADIGSLSSEGQPVKQDETNMDDVWI